MDLIQFIGKGLAAGFIVVSVAEISRRFPRLGALVLTLPIVIPAVFILMYLRSKELTPISRMSREILMLIPLGLPFFIPLALADRLGWSFWFAFAAGLIFVSATIGTYLWMTPGR